MREIDNSTDSKSPLKVAILAALNITDELFQERIKEEGAVSTDIVGSRIQELSKTLDRALSDKMDEK